MAGMSDGNSKQRGPWSDWWSIVAVLVAIGIMVALYWFYNNVVMKPLE